jgi:hypothetical protein
VISLLWTKRCIAILVMPRTSITQKFVLAQNIFVAIILVVLDRFGAIFDLGKQRRLDPGRAMRHFLGVGLGPADQRNRTVGPIHPKAMPVILTTPDEVETSLTAPAAEALKLQRPLPGLFPSLDEARGSDHRTMR